MVLHKQPAGGVYQSLVCQLFQPRPLPCSQLTTPGALGWLLHPLEPSHETSGVFKLFTVHCTICDVCSLSILYTCLFFIPLIRNLFTSATRSCWRSELSCRREWMSCSGRWPTVRRRLPPSVQARPHAPSLQYRPLFDTTLIAFAKAESYLGGYKRIVPKTVPLVIQHIPTLP